MKYITIQNVYFKVAVHYSNFMFTAKKSLSLRAVVAVQVIFISIYAFTIQKHKIGRKVHDWRELKIYMACCGGKRRFLGIIFKTLKIQTGKAITGPVGQTMTSMDLQSSSGVSRFTRV